MAVVLVASVLAGIATAQSCQIEVEPNDTPAQALPLEDYDCLVGEMAGTDQDAFVWEVSDDDALRAWSLEVQGIPGQLTKVDVIDVAFADDGSSVVSASTVTSWGTNDGSASRGEPFLIAPGRYVLGVSTSGGEGQYVAHLRDEGEIRLGRDRIGGREQSGAHALYGLVEDDRAWPWSLDADQARFRWRLRLRAPPGSGLSLELRDGAGGTVGRADVGDDGTATLTSLGLEAGTYELAILGAEGATPVTLDVETRGRLTDGGEVEPNDAWTSANVLSFDTPMRAAGRGYDYFLVDVGVEQAATTWDLVVESATRLTVVLVDAERNEVQQRRGDAGALRGLVLDEGEYGVRVYADEDGDYTLRFEEAGPIPQAGFEREPNDTRVVATPMSDENTARGSLAPQDTDVLSFEVLDEPGTWRVQAIGEGITDLAAYDGGGHRTGAVSGERRLRLDNLVLAPGRHYVAVEGEGDYAVRALRVGPVPPPPEPEPAAETEPLEPAAADASQQADETPVDASDDAELDEAVAPGPPPPPGWLEQEPNDERTEAGLLMPGVVRVGTLPSRNDRDLYRFSLDNDQYVRIEAVPPEDGQVGFDLTRGGRTDAFGIGEPAVFERWLLAGDYELVLFDREPFNGYYQLRLTMLDPIALPEDTEPNDTQALAIPLPRDLELEGIVGNMGDVDFIRLPVFSEDTEMELGGALEGVSVALYSDGERLSRTDTGYRTVLPAGATTYLRLTGRTRYRLEASFERPPNPDQLRRGGPDPALALTTASEPYDVAAYAREGQRIEGTFDIANDGDTVRTVSFEAHASQWPVRIELPEPRELGPGERATVPFAVDLPDDLRDDQPLEIRLAARSDEGLATAPVTVAARCETAPVDPRVYAPVPDALRGHLNVAWAPFGATLLDSDTNNDAYLNDGVASPGRGSYRDAGESFTLDLPGDSPIRLTGTLLNPQSRGIDRQLRRFEISTSLDGETFTPVLDGWLDAARVEQGFVFPTPVEARYVRLTAIDAQLRTDGGWIGEWKVLSDSFDVAGEVDVADARLGGFLVWSDPLLPVNSVLAGTDGRPRLDGRRFETASFVVGFQQGRAARVAGIEWIESERGTPEQWFGTVDVAASLAGPVGPWTELGSWPLEHDADGTVTIAFAEPTWARYLRFTMSGHDRELGTVWAPETVRVLEAPSDGDYTTILGEWGFASSTGPYEFERGVPNAAEVGPDDGSDDTREGARVVGDGDVVSSTVLVNEDEDWLRIDVPEGSNLVDLEIAGDPSSIRWAFVDEDGDPVLHDRLDDDDRVHLTAFVDPGSYYLHVDEPKRSVVFSWDTSGSVGPFEPITYASVSSFGRDVDPDREFVQMLAFDDPAPKWLLPYWTGDPNAVSRALGAFDRASVGSSEAEVAMYEAVRALGQREGTRAVLFITDHESGSYNLTSRLWRAFEEVRPRVFTFEVSSGGSGITQDRMQAYAAANGGVYDYARGVGDFDVGFRRASCHLRRPKAYTVDVAVRYQAPPGPGTLRVERGSDANLPALEVVFDASGSMGAKLPTGASRIDAARGVLDELVEEVLPEGTPFALRAFGHITPQSCESRLDVPLAPLDRAAARAAIAGIQPKLLSQTPIADALLAVADDLAEASGRRSVILISDGEESCGGDPAASLAELRDRGIDVQLTIVTLGVDDADTRERFASLAASVGGAYIAADDGDALRAAVTEALNPPFEVLDAAGQIVAQGRVDGAGVELPMGIYTIRVPGTPPILVRDVRVPGDETHVVRLEDR